MAQPMPLSPNSNDHSILESAAIRFLSYRPRFKAEVVNRMAKKAGELGLTDPFDLINQIIDSLERAGFVDDAKNLINYIRYRLETKMKGPYWIKMSLLRLGVSKIDIEKSLRENAPRQTQTRVIRRFIEKKLRGSKPDQKTKAKLYRALIGRGFSASLVAEAFDGGMAGEV